MVKAFLDGHALDMHFKKKKMTMVANSEVVMKEDSLVNLVTRYGPRSILLPSSSASFQNS